MNHKRLIAAAAAMCICMAGVFPTSGYTPLTVSNVCAEDAVNASVVNLACVGDTTTISLAGTTEIPKWKSDDESIAKVTSNGDLSATVTAVGKGTTAVYAVLSQQTIRFDVTVLRATKDELIPIDSGTITLTQDKPNAEAKLSIPEDTEVIWKTSDKNVAAVDQTGKIKAVGKGECTVTAVCNGFAYNIAIISEYTPSVPIEPEEICIGEIVLTNDARGQKLSFPEDVSVKFRSTDESVATVSEDGIIVAMNEGECRIYAEMDGQLSYVNVKSTYKPKEQGSDGNVLGSVTLNEINMSQKITVNNVPEGARVVWSSSDRNVAVVTQSGVIIAVNKGTCVVTVDAGGVEYTVNVTVELKEKDEFEITQIRGIGTTMTINAKELGENPKFTSTDKSIVTVDSKGTVTAVGEGVAVIIAESDTAVSYLRVKVTKAGILGDANCDGEVSIADATAILQHIGNMDMYRLSDEGMINGDVDGKRGITGNDALVLQMFDAKLVSTLTHQLQN